MANIHKLGSVEQRDDETIAYTFGVSAITSSPASPACSVLDITDVDSPAAGGTLTGSASVSGTNITTQLLGTLTEGKVYRLITTFTDGASQTWSRYIDVTCVGDND